MKFGAKYSEALQNEAYPKEWIESSISYKKLKKCIKRVQQELISLGLDQKTLEALWQHVSSSNLDGAHDDPSSWIHYSFSTDPNIKFVPKLTVAIDPRDGSPMDAWLSPDTKKFLRRVGRRQSIESRTQHTPNGIVNHETHEYDLTSGEASAAESESHSITEKDKVETIEVPLSSDSEFFQILRNELRNLDTLQDNEQHEIEQEILQLGNDLRTLSSSDKKRSKAEIEAWREVFRIYTDSEVFMSSHEQDAGVRDGQHAETQLRAFTNSLSLQQTKGLKLSKDATVALDRFLRINVNLLRLLKFQEINRLALSKIMKKFDKRTALHAQASILRRYSERPLMSKDLARATCYTISDQLLKIIPQLDDYLCPVCFGISWKPVKLRCGHVFCIRCMVVLQRANKDECPLCREKVVLEATGAHVDEEMLKFLKKNFRAEVKEKQRQNEIAAGVDRFGETYTHNHKCTVM